MNMNMNKNKGISADESPRLDLNEPYVPPRVAENNDLYAHLTKQFQVNLLDVWKKTLDEEVAKRKVAEAKLAKKEEELKRSNEMYMTCSLEYAKLEAEIDMMRDAGYSSGSGSGTGVGVGAAGEEVQSGGHSNIHSRREDTVCGECLRRMANVIWVPCRHLAVCSKCDETATYCPVCCCKKEGTNLKINWP